MKKIIKKIFSDHDFNEYELSLNGEENNVLFFANINKNIVDFYVVVFVNKIENTFLDERVPEIFSAIKSLEKGYDPRMDKNLSMLVCLHTDNGADLKELHKNIFEIEEDPYFFKKYVFSFTKEQEKTLTELFEREEGENSKSIINKVVNDNKNFISFKRNPDILNDSEYGLCSRLLIKLPFIVFERGEKKIADLSKKIMEDLQTKNIEKEIRECLEIEIEDNIYIVDDILKMIEGDK
ncbi:ABC-three component system middle component 1 [Bacillus toyonensis]|uniref:ABC-three component system middle component 1 n=1 Tax=Bacillus toyonensis TaxID=155322 RepID=UPI00027C0031|nr:ABC-three component system middle component 1 [Bacillus toyonensis]EJV95956.1 hypothetical protein IGI_01049 [Bacillus toyonensis]